MRKIHAVIELEKDKDLFEWLDEYARKVERSKSGVLKIALREYRARIEKYQGVGNEH